jgi:hypothetical protein
MKTLIIIEEKYEEPLYDQHGRVFEAAHTQTMQSRSTQR